MKNLEPWGRAALENASLAVNKDGETVYTAAGRGIKPLLDLLETSPELLAGAAAADKIVGRAAALLFLKGGVLAVYGEVMSGAAHTLLTAKGIQTACGARVASIANRDGTGICPMERAVLNVDDPDDAPGVLRDALSRLMRP